MALQGKIIKNKIASVKSIRKITKTMEMVSVAKMRRATERSTRSKRFAHEAYEILATIADRQTIDNHQVFSVPKNAEKKLVVIIASHKGMCGGYNVNVSKKVKEYIAQNSTETFEVITIGKQADKIARRSSLPIIASFSNFSETVTSDESFGLSNILLENFYTKKFKSVIVIATEFIKAMEYKVQEIPLLPISLELSKKYSSEDVLVKGAENYLFEPSVESIIDTVVPKLLNTIIFQILLDAFASEHSARMIAMKNATDNAGSLLDDLMLNYNQVRQASITQELSEIVAGASALS